MNINPTNTLIKLGFHSAPTIRSETHAEPSPKSFSFIHSFIYSFIIIIHLPFHSRVVAVMTKFGCVHVYAKHDSIRIKRRVQSHHLCLHSCTSHSSCACCCRRGRGRGRGRVTVAVAAAVIETFGCRDSSCRYSWQEIRAEAEFTRK